MAEEDKSEQHSLLGNGGAGCHVESVEAEDFGLGKWVVPKNVVQAASKGDLDADSFLLTLSDLFGEQRSLKLLPSLARLVKNDDRRRSLLKAARGSGQVEVLGADSPNGGAAAPASPAPEPSAPAVEEPAPAPTEAPPTPEAPTPRECQNAAKGIQ